MRAAQCIDCPASFWSFNERGPLPKRCGPCEQKHRRELGRERQQKRRARVGWKRKTTPPDRSRGGGSISEGTPSITGAIFAVNPEKPISRVAEGREGRGNPPLASVTIALDPDFLARREALATGFAEQRARSCQFFSDPRPVIHGGNVHV